MNISPKAGSGPASELVSFHQGQVRELRIEQRDVILVPLNGAPPTRLQFDSERHLTVLRHAQQLGVPVQAAAHAMTGVILALRVPVMVDRNKL